MLTGWRKAAAGVALTVAAIAPFVAQPGAQPTLDDIQPPVPIERVEPGLAERFPSPDSKTQTIAPDGLITPEGERFGIESDKSGPDQQTIDLRDRANQGNGIGGDRFESGQGPSGAAERIGGERNLNPVGSQADGSGSTLKLHELRVGN